LPGALAELQSGFEIFLQFALHVGAIDLAEKSALEVRNEVALGKLAILQAKYQTDTDPALRFVALLRAAMTNGSAHVADRKGNAPGDAQRWGWKTKPNGRGLAPRGRRIGWLNGGDLFLESAASYQVAKEMAGVDGLAISEQTLRHRLRDRGLLASVDEGRQMVQVRRTIHNKPRLVLHLKSSILD
jgi:hypothetical protein